MSICPFPWQPGHSRNRHTAANQPDEPPYLRAVQFYIFRHPNLGFLLPASPEGEQKLEPFRAEGNPIERAAPSLLGVRIEGEGIARSSLQMELVGVTDLTEDEYTLWMRDTCEQILEVVESN